MPRWGLGREGKKEEIEDVYARDSFVVGEGGGLAERC